MEEARAILEPYHQRLREAVEGGWAEWKLLQSCRSEHGLAPVLYGRTICNVVFDAIARIAIFSFATDPKVHVEIEPQTFKLHFPNLCVRIKKGDDDHLGRNVPTQAVLAFVEADGLLPGMPPETGKVEVVWLPNEIWTDVDRILVVARDGDQLIWEYEIDRSKPSAEVVPFPTPTEPDPGDSPLVRPRTSAKLDTKQQ